MINSLWLPFQKPAVTIFYLYTYLRMSQNFMIFLGIILLYRYFLLLAVFYHCTYRFKHDLGS